MLSVAQQDWRGRRARLSVAQGVVVLGQLRTMERHAGRAEQAASASVSEQQGLAPWSSSLLA
jgi:hypothetical protein